MNVRAHAGLAPGTISDRILNRARPAVQARILSATALVPLFALVVLLQWVSGAFTAEFGGHPDEAAHYVTGLLVRDYIASGVPADPLTFAERYYEHYPKVALGNWPPLFYVIQAAWTLVLSPDRISVLLLMALLTTAVAWLVMRIVARDFGPAAALFGGALFVTFPLVQQHAGMVMTEIPMALVSFLAALSFGRYLQHERARDSVLFGLFAAAAIMIKGSGLLLVLLVPIAVALSGRWRLVRRRSFWYPVPIVAVLAGPWTYAFREVARAGWQDPDVSLFYTASALYAFPMILVVLQGAITAAFAGIGTIAVLSAVRRRAVSAEWAAVVALCPAVIIFHAAVPASLDHRHMLPAMPAWAALAAAGVAWTHRRVWARPIAVRWIPFGAAVAGLIIAALPPVPKYGRGFGAVVSEVVEQPGNANAVFLVSSDATGEGMFVAEVAMREHRPGHIIRRASKLMAQQAWHGGRYVLTTTTADELIAALREADVRFVVLDGSIPASLQAPHHELLRRTAATSPLFPLRGTWPVTRGYGYRAGVAHVFPSGLSVYELQPAGGVAAGRTPH